jgi:hypothetical protein
MADQHHPDRRSNGELISRVLLVAGLVLALVVIVIVSRALS